MTQPTLVVTHADGFLGCFTRESDGTMRQRALIDTGDQPPTAVELANVGTSLAEQYGWSFGPAVHDRALKKGGRALPAGTRASKAPGKAARKSDKRDPKVRGYTTHPGDPAPAERPALILAYVQTNPYSTMAEIVAGIGLEPEHSRVSRWHHTFNAMWKDKVLDKRRREHGKGRVWEWFAIATTGET